MAPPLIVSRETSETAAARTILEHYILDAPDARTAIADEKWLGHRDIGWLLQFENSVDCLRTVLRRVIESKRGWPDGS